MGKQRYYEAYDLRYRQVHGQGLEWFSGMPTPIVAEALQKCGISPETPMLEIGCGEGHDAAFLLGKGCNLLATDVSPAAVDFCRAKYPEWAEHFDVLDALADPLEARFDFIYAVAVLHMLVPDEDRNRLLTFIREHLTENGFGLVVTMGDGEMQRATDITKAFDVQARVHEGSGKTVEIASTSCRIVTRDDFRREIEGAGLVITEMGDAVWDDVPFAMYAIVKRG
ncbi:MAG: class I SAM-dependent methyltransferase [Clostridiales bacterium]|nr:class I SAM-dependent methyltransferase [Clostridiales bacterium]